MKSLIFIIFLELVITSPTDRPNYITDEEFAAIHGLVIPVSNSSVLPLPKYSDRRIQPRPGFGKNFWPNGRVPYTLDVSFSDEQRRQVALALQEYNNNTCIKFVPKKDDDANWVDIEYDKSSDACGVAEVCMMEEGKGKQYAKFGGPCVIAGTMIHELGHTLCASHEMTRLDRDTWIGFDTSKCTAPAKDSNYYNEGLNKLYDYLSIEHYEGECYYGCYLPKQQGVTKCGSGGTLSVLDIEIFNEIYNCTSGCYGYRYVNSKRDLSHAIHAGTEHDNSTLYSCRAYWMGDIIPGKFHPVRKVCYLPWNGKEHIVTGDFIEILTNPNNAKFEWVTSSSLPSNAIRGGRSNERETIYVITCQLNIDGLSHWTPGKYQPSAGAYTSFGGNEIKCHTYRFLVCFQ